MTARRFARWALALGIATVPLQSAFAGAPPDITPEERALMPRWCNYVQGWDDTSPVEYKKMVDQYGEGWSHMHHYCWSLVDVFRLDQRALRKPPGYADARRAIGGLDYVLRNSPKDFVFRTEVLALRAKLMARYVGLDPAIKTAVQLVQEWPKYADGYTILADLLLKAKKRDEALAVLARGEELASDKERFARQKSILQIN